MFGTVPALPCLALDVGVPEDGRVSAAALVRLAQVWFASEQGPQVVYFGLAGADGSVIAPTRVEGGVPVFTRPGGSGFQLVVEAAPGPQGRAVGLFVPQAGPVPEPGPDVRIQASQSVGDGNPVPCEGGVPGVPVFRLEEEATSRSIASDWACGAVANPNVGRACTVDEFGLPRFVAAERATAQFCLPVTSSRAFPLGETWLMARVRDVSGVVGVPRWLKIRVGATAAPAPTSTPTITRVVSATPSPSSSRSALPTGSVVPSRTATLSPTASATRTARTVRPSPSATLTVLLTATPTPTRVPEPTTALPSRSPTPTLSASEVPTATPTRFLPSSTHSATATQRSRRTRTPRPTWSLTATPSVLVTPSVPSSRTQTPSPTANPSDSRTVTTSQTVPRSPTPTRTLTARAATATWTRSATATRTPTYTWTALGTRTFTATRTPVPTGSPTLPPTGIATLTPTPTFSSAPSRTQTRTRTATATARLGQSPTPTVTGVLPTVTATSTATASASRTASRTRSLTPTRTFSRTPTVSPTSSPSPTSSLPPSPSFSATPSRTRSSTPTPSHTPSPTFTWSPRSTPTFTSSPTHSRTPRPSRTPTISPTPSFTPTLTATRSPSMTRTPSSTPSVTLSTTASRTPSVTATPTATVPPEPRIVYFGLVRADDQIVPATGTTPEGWPVYERPFGSGFSIVLEAQPGGAGTALGLSTFQWNPGDPSVLPDLAIVSSRPLGNGSTEVCDDQPPRLGGVPAAQWVSVLPPPQEIADAINDLACRFKNGLGMTSGRGRDEACSAFQDGTYRFLVNTATVQFCGFVNESIAFPPGETVLTARVRDTAGRWSETRSIVVRIVP